MRTLALLLMLSTGQALAFSPSLPEYEADFAAAKECRKDDKGRMVWAGEKAYYVQSWMFWTDQSGLLDPENVSVMDKSEQSPGALINLANLCEDD